MLLIMGKYNNINQNVNNYLIIFLPLVIIFLTGKILSVS
jgi:hypothetical protein